MAGAATSAAPGDSPRPTPPAPAPATRARPGHRPRHRVLLGLPRLRLPPGEELLAAQTRHDINQTRADKERTKTEGEVWQ